MKKKALILTILSSMTLAAGGLAVALSANQLGFIDSAAGEKVTGSILFSRETGSFTRIDEKTSSTSATTGNGSTYYAIAHSISDVESTGYIAQFGFGDIDTQYVTFSTNPTGGADFEFQKITGIKIATASASNQTLYAQSSSDGVNFSNAYSVTCNSSPEKVTFDSPLTYIRVGTGSAQTRNIRSIELFYECGEDPEPAKEVDHLSFSSMKSNYVLGDSFEEPTVVAYYTDGTHEEVEASFSDVDMTKTGKQTVTATYQGVSKDFTIEVWPSSTAQHITYKGFFVEDYEETETSVFLKDSSVLPYYGEPGETVTFTPVFKDAYIYADCSEETGEIVFVLDGKNVTFTMPNSGVEICIMYQSNPFKQLSYVGYDLGSDESVSISTFIDESTFLPPRAKPGDTVSVTPVAKSGFAIDGVLDMSEAVTITENDGAYSFTMPSYNFEVTIMFHEIVTLESIYVKDPKTSYSVGSNFVIPTVMGVYSNGYEEKLTVSANNFSGFDSSAEATGQVITVSYEGVADVTYTVDIIEGYKDLTIEGNFQVAQGSNTMSLEFKAEGRRGQYVYINAFEVRKNIIDFTYELDENGVVAIDLDDATAKSNITAYANGYRIVNANASVDEWVNTTGAINAGQTEFSIRMWRISSGVYSQDETPLVFSKI